MDLSTETDPRASITFVASRPALPASSTAAPAPIAHIPRAPVFQSRRQLRADAGGAVISTETCVTRALAEVFIAHRAQLKCIARKIVGTLEIAEEIAQEAYLKLMQGVCTQAVDRPFCYCCQVVRNLALDYCRRQAVEATYRVYTYDGELPQVPGIGMPDQSLHERCVLDAVDSALASLPTRTRQAFELHRVSGLTQREVARELGCSATLVNFMLKDATAALAPCRAMLEHA